VEHDRFAAALCGSNEVFLRRGLTKSEQIKVTPDTREICILHSTGVTRDERADSCGKIAKEHHTEVQIQNASRNMGNN
jgi:hypothetical protein